MSSPAGTVVAHPLVDFAARLNRALDRLVDTPCWSMTTGELQSTIVELTRAAGRVEELRLRVLAAGDRADVAAETAASSTAAWLAHTTRVPARQAHRDVDLALTLDTDLR